MGAWRIILCVALLFFSVSGATGQVTWNVTFGDVVNNTNVGFDDALLGPTRQTTFLAALDYIDSVIDENGIGDISINNSQTDGSGFLASAGAYYPTSPNGFKPGRLFEHVTTGVDPSPFSPDAVVTFDFGFNWNSGTAATVAGQYDLFSVAVHEVTHALGFASLVDASGNSKITGGDPGVFTTYDAFLERSGNPLFAAGGNFVGTPADLTSGEVVFAGPSAVIFNNGAPVPVFSPNPFQSGSSISHITTSNAVMRSSISSGVMRRAYLTPEAGILSDLDYDLTSTNYWVRTSGGAYGTAAHWSAGVPGVSDAVDFSRPSTYTVTFATDPTNSRLRVSTGTVTFDLNGNTYTLSDSVDIHMGALTVTDGTLSSSDSSIARLNGSIGSVTVGASGTWIVAGSLHVGGDSGGPGGIGTLTAANGGLLDISNTLKLWDNGTLVLQNGGVEATLVDVDGGTLSGSGSINADLINDGTVRPGASAGLITVLLDYDQSAGGVLEIELGGLMAGTEFDQLSVTGNVTLDGTLQVSLLGLFNPAWSDSFSILTGASIAGTFAAEIFPSLDLGLEFLTLYNTADVTLRVFAVGDVDDDGDVDFDDFLLLQLGFAISSGAARGDGDLDGDGDVDFDDFLVLQVNFGNSFDELWASGGESLDASAVPEPSSLVLAAMSAVSLLTFRLRRRGRCATGRRRAAAPAT